MVQLTLTQGNKGLDISRANAHVRFLLLFG